MKRIFTILLMLVVLCVGEGYAQYNKRYIAWASRNMLASDNYKDAIDILNVLIRSDRNSYEAYYLRGYAKLGLGDLLGAESDLSAALEINPVYTEAYHYRGIVHAELGNYEDAVRDFTAAIDLRPDIAGSYYSRGVTHLRNKQWVKSLVDFDMVLRFTDKDAQTHINRGVALLGMRDTLGAHENFDLAIRTNRDYSEAYNQKATLLLQQERNEEALEMFNQAIRCDSTYLAPIFNRAITLCNLERYQEAIGDYRRVLELSPYTVSAYFNLAIIHSILGDYPKALENYNLVVEHAPENVKGYYNRAGVLSQMERNFEALADYTRAIELYPDFAGAYLQRAVVKDKLHDGAGASRDRAIADRKIAEYEERLEKDSEGLAMWADTSRSFNRLVSFESRMAERQLNKEEGTSSSLRGLYCWTVGAPESTRGHHYYSPLLEDAAVAKGENITFSNEPSTLSEEEISALDKRYEAEAYSSVEALFRRGISQLGVRQYTSAINILSEAIRLSPEDAMLHLARGVARAEMIEFISEVSGGSTIALDTDMALRSSTSKRTFNYDEAIADLNRAAELAPDFAYTYYNRGNLKALSGDMPGSYDDYSRALELAPELADAYFNRGLVQLYMKDVRKGTMDLSKAGELGIKDAYSIIKRYQNSNK